MDVPALLGEEEAERTQMTVGAVLALTDLASGETTEIMPVYAIRMDRSVNAVPAYWEAMSIFIAGMTVDTGEITLGLEGVAGPDYVIIQAYEKPAISLVWIGIILLTGGFLLSASRRIREARWQPRRRKQ